jgi:hypothetical protein
LNLKRTAEGEFKQNNFSLPLFQSKSGGGSGLGIFNNDIIEEKNETSVKKARISTAEIR